MSDDCITIVSSDNEDVQIIEGPSSTTNNESVKLKINEAVRRITPVTVKSSKVIFSKFLKQCKEADKSSDMGVAVEKLWKRFHRADPDYINSPSFINLIERSMEKVFIEPYCQMINISDELKYHIKVANKEITTSAPIPSSSDTTYPPISTDSSTSRNIEKLQKALSKLHRKIEYLENQEIDFNSSDEENSAYIQVSRYKERVCQIFEKLCQLQKKDCTAERSIKKNIRFSGTKFPVLNRTIEKYYNDKKQFPDYHDVLNLVQTVNKVKNLNLQSYEIEETAKQAFRELGKLLKTCRQYDFYDTFSMYLPSDQPDPASLDSNLKKKLDDNEKLYGDKIDVIIDKYVVKQNELRLEPVEVNSNNESESEETDESKEKDRVWDSDIEETVFKYDQGNILDTDKEVEPENIFIPCKVVLYDIKNDPIWEKYKPLNKNKIGYIENITIKSDNENNDKCISTDSDSNSDVTKRKHEGINDDLNCKKLKCSSDLTNLLNTKKSVSNLITYKNNELVDDTISKQVTNFNGIENIIIKESNNLNEDAEKLFMSNVTNQENLNKNSGEITEIANKNSINIESKNKDNCVENHNSIIDELVEKTINLKNSDISEKKVDVMIVNAKKINETERTNSVGRDNSIEIIDVEKIVDKPKASPKSKFIINLSQFIRNMKFESRNSSFNPLPVITSTPKPSTSSSMVNNNKIVVPSLKVPNPVNSVYKENIRDSITPYNKHISGSGNFNRQLSKSNVSNWMNSCRPITAAPNNRMKFFTKSFNSTSPRLIFNKHSHNQRHKQFVPRYMQSTTAIKRQTATASHQQRFISNSGSMIQTKRITTVVEEQQVVNINSTKKSQVGQTFSHSRNAIFVKHVQEKQEKQEKPVTTVASHEVITLD